MLWGPHINPSSLLVNIQNTYSNRHTLDLMGDRENMFLTNCSLLFAHSHTVSPYRLQSFHSFQYNFNRHGIDRANERERERGIFHAFPPYFITITLLLFSPSFHVHPSLPRSARQQQEKWLEWNCIPSGYTSQPTSSFPIHCSGPHSGNIGAKFQDKQTRKN